MAVTLNKPRHLVRDLVDDGKAVRLALDLLELHLLDVLDNDLVDLQKFLDDAGMLQLQHDLHELPQLQHVLRVVDVLVEELLEVGVLARFLYHLDHVDLLLLAAAGEQEPTVELYILLLPLLPLVVLVILGCVWFLVVDVLRLVGDQRRAVLRPVLLDVLHLRLGLFLALRCLAVHLQ